MRPLKDIQKAIAKAPIHVERQTDETVFKGLLGEVPQSPDSIGWRMQTRLHIACLASAVIVIVAATWLLHARPVAPKQECTQVTQASPSRITLLTELSLERAYRRGGIEAVEDQCREALAVPAEKSVEPSCKELLAELTGDAETLGGANL
jgi:hypothetical protein